jgi:hypothetical protein
MTLAERQKQNDLFRTTFKGGKVQFSACVSELDERVRGRALIRLTRYDTFHPESDHSEGVFVFAGWSFLFAIDDEPDGSKLLFLSMADDFK